MLSRQLRHSARPLEREPVLPRGSTRWSVLLAADDCTARLPGGEQQTARIPRPHHAAHHWEAPRPARDLKVMKHPSSARDLKVIVVPVLCLRSLNHGVPKLYWRSLSREALRSALLQRRSRELWRTLLLMATQNYLRLSTKHSIAGYVRFVIYITGWWPTAFFHKMYFYTCLWPCALLLYKFYLLIKHIRLFSMHNYYWLDCHEEANCIIYYYIYIYLCMYIILGCIGIYQTMLLICIQSSVVWWGLM